MDLSGCFTALVTPFDEQGHVDIETFRKFVRWQVESGVDGLVVLGTTGENHSLTQQEESQLVKAAVSEVASQIPVVVGTGMSDTFKSVEKTRWARDMGADAAMILLPYCNRPPVRGIYQHFEKLYQVGLPLISYHQPKRTGTLLTVDELANIPGVCAIKEASGCLEFAEKLIQKADVPVFCGDDMFTESMMKAGGRGAVSVLANALPREWSQVVHAGGIERYQELLEAMNREINPITIKCLLSLLGKMSGSLRLPLVEATDSTRLALLQAMTHLQQCPATAG